MAMVTGGRVVLAGSVNTDVVVTAERAPDAGETVLGSGVAFVTGGKGANQAVAARRGGADVVFVGRVGSDELGGRLRDFLEDEGVDVTALTVGEGASGLAMITVDGNGENRIVVVPGANATLSAGAATQVAVGSGDVLVTQLEIPVRTAEAFLRHGRAVGARTMLNPSPAGPLPRALLVEADVVVVNRGELAALDPDPGAGAGLEEALRRVRVRPDQVLIVTLGSEGAMTLVGDELLATPALDVAVVDSTGAGDCFVGFLAARLVAGVELREALETSAAAAAICVGRPGAAPSMPTLNEVRGVSK